MTAHFMVVGNPIAHSQSPELHQAFAEQVGLDICYSRQLCPIDEDSFVAVISAFFNGGGVGANVTVPFKQMAYQLCEGSLGEDSFITYDSLTPYAQVAGAVNTLYLDGEQLCGHNTDGQGLVNHLYRLGWQLKHKKVAIIGAGGASRGVVLPLLSAGVRELHIANRTVSKAENIIADCRQQVERLPADMAKCLQNAQFGTGHIEAMTGHYDLIINATSIGLSGEQLPLSDELSCDHAYDMMYGRQLPFLQHFEEKGASVSDGYGMLIGQAVLSFELWTGKHIDVASLDLTAL